MPWQRRRRIKGDYGQRGTWRMSCWGRDWFVDEMGMRLISDNEPAASERAKTGRLKMSIERMRWHGDDWSAAAGRLRWDRVAVFSGWGFLQPEVAQEVVYEAGETLPWRIIYNCIWSSPYRSYCPYTYHPPYYSEYVEVHVTAPPPSWAKVY